MAVRDDFAEDLQAMQRIDGHVTFPKGWLQEEFRRTREEQSALAEIAEDAATSLFRIAKALEPDANV